MSDQQDPPTGFETGLELAKRRGLAPVAQVVPAEALRIEIISDPKSLWKQWDDFASLKNAILQDPACFDVIEGTKEMNRTGATRLGTAFGLTLEIVNVVQQPLEEGDVRFQVRARAGRGSRYADGVGTARLSEIPKIVAERGKPGDPNYRPARDVPIGQREHFALARAETRGKKRAISDLLGGTEAD